MKSEVSAFCCRICLTKSKKLRSLYKPVDEGDEPPNEMLLKLTGIVVEEMDKYTMLPKNICKNCELSLSMAFEFREKVLQSQETIEAYMQELQVPYPEERKPKIKVNSKEKYFKEEDDDVLIEVQQLDESALEENLQMLENNNDGSHLHLDELQLPNKCEGDEYDHEVHGTEEFTEETLDDAETYEIEESGDDHHTYPQEEIHEQQYEEVDNDVNEEGDDGDNDANDNDDDDDGIVHIENDIDVDAEAEDLRQQYVEVLQNAYMNERPSITKQKNTWDTAVNEIIIDALQAEPELKKPIKPQRGRKPKLPKNVSYICDICGNVYAKRGRMMEHRQRHDKQLRYACELCDEKFHMRELLRKHMYSHSGGKPLKCKYCSRTFYYESVKKAHEAVHQGVKPYVCDVCGKPFSYAHSLKKHKLIHAEVKLYRCEYCNKDFRLQHHMKQHKLTRLHKKAVSFAEGGHFDDNISSLDMDNDEELAEDVMMEEEEIEDEEEIANVS